MVHTLTRHPAVRPTESLWGFILRLSVANGYKTPWNILQRAGLKQYQTRGSAIAVEGLSIIAKQKLLDLQSVAYQPKNPSKSALLLGHPIPLTALELDHPRLCTECVEELGFIEAQWDLRVMSGCPVHMRRALTRCPSCSRLLRWYRPSLLRCECGSRLEQAQTQELSLQEADLLQVLRCKILRILPLTSGSSGIPERQLADLDLKTFLKVIRVLAKSLRQICPLHQANYDAITAASDILRDWPKQFRSLLSSLKSLKQDQMGDIRKRYAPLYCGLLKAENDRHNDGLNFLREAFFDFACNEDPDLPADLRLMREYTFSTQRRYVTRAEFARIANVNPRTVPKILEANRPKSRSSAESGRPTKAIDLQQFQWVNLQPGLVMGVRRAAAYLGIPVEMLRLLREIGAYKVEAMPPNRLGFHERDLEVFASEIFAKADESTLETIEDGVCLKSIFRSRQFSYEFKATLIREILQGGCRVFKGSARNIAELVVDRASLVSVRKANADEQGLTASEVASLLHCHIDTVVGLVRIGAVDGAKAGCKWRINQESLLRFLQEYWPTSSLVLSRGISARRLERLCREKGINLLYVPLHGDRSKLYARSTDKGRILKLLDCGR